MPYAYVDPDTGEIYPIETTSPTLFIPAGPLRFFYKNVGQIALCAFVITAALAFLADAWWFYHWENQKTPGHPQPSCPENRTERFGLPRGVPQRRRAGQAVPVL